MNAFRFGQRRDGIALVHVFRVTPTGRSRPPSSEPDPNRSWCGTFANSNVVVVDPATPLAEDLSWCGRCVGRAAEHAGRLADVVALLLAGGYLATYRDGGR